MAQVANIAPITGSVFEPNDKAARKQLAKWGIEKKKMALMHLSASIRLGRRSKKCGFFSVSVLVLAIGAASADYHGIFGGLVGSEKLFINLKDNAALVLGFAGVMLYLMSDGMEYQKRAALHHHAYNDYSHLCSQIDALMLRQTLLSRDIDQLLADFQRVTERSPTVHAFEEHNDSDRSVWALSLPWKRRIHARSRGK